VDRLLQGSHFSFHIHPSLTKVQNQTEILFGCNEVVYQLNFVSFNHTSDRLQLHNNHTFNNHIGNEFTHGFSAVAYGYRLLADRSCYPVKKTYQYPEMIRRFDPTCRWCFRRPPFWIGPVVKPWPCLSNTSKLFSCGPLTLYNRNYYTESLHNRNSPMHGGAAVITVMGTAIRRWAIVMFFNDGRPIGGDGNLRHRRVLQRLDHLG